MPKKRERHASENIGWLRAAVLGANDGILSTASLVLGVAASHGTHANIMVAGVAGLVAGAMSMAAGEYVSVHSQADTEQADLEQERTELKTDSKSEHEELAAIYAGRGVDPSLARQVADQLMAHDALEAHARDELGITKNQKARPIQAALASAASFAVGAGLPLLITALGPEASLVWLVSGTSLFFFGASGRGGGERRGRQRRGGSNARYFLGRISDGCYCRRGGVGWNGACVSANVLSDRGKRTLRSQRIRAYEFDLGLAS